MVRHHVTMTIGDLSRRTGVTVAALRAWEQRHGFPTPQRLPSGHRRYTEADVAAVEAVEIQRGAGLRLDQAIRSVQADTAQADTGAGDSMSIYGVLRRRHPGLVAHRLRKRTLVAVSRAIEDHCCAYASAGVLYGAFQRERYYRASQARWAELARTTTQVTVFADFATSDLLTHPIEIALPIDAPMRREWAVVSDGSALPVALTAWEIPGQHHLPDPERLFEGLWTVDPAAGDDAARTCRSLAAAHHPSPDTLDQTEFHLTSPRPARSPRQPDPQSVTALMNRMLAYMDQTNWPGQGPLV